MNFFAQGLDVEVAAALQEELDALMVEINEYEAAHSGEFYSVDEFGNEYFDSAEDENDYYLEQALDREDAELYGAYDDLMYDDLVDESLF